MNSMPVVWTGRRSLSLPMIAGMAPDHGTWRAADTLARSGKGGPGGGVVDGESVLLWAEFSDGQRPPALPSVLLPHLVVACSCSSNQFPCRHVLALLLLDWAAPTTAAGAPEWAATRLETGLRAARAGALRRAGGLTDSAASGTSAECCSSFMAVGRADAQPEKRGSQDSTKPFGPGPPRAADGPMRRGPLARAPEHPLKRQGPYSSTRSIPPLLALPT